MSLDNHPLYLQFTGLFVASVITGSVEEKEWKVD